MNTWATQAVVVRLTDYGESDRIVTFLTRDRGRVSAMARAARVSKRRFGSGLSLFALGQAHCASRRTGELARLARWELETGHVEIGTCVAKMAHAGYVCEAARELSAPDHGEPEVFDLLAEALAVLAHPGRPACAPMLRVFEIRLLDAIGLGPRLDRCTACGGQDFGGAGQRFDLIRGGVTCGSCHGVGPELPERARQALLAARALCPAEAAERLPLDEATNAACREVLLAALYHQLGHPLRSVEFLSKLQAAGRRATGSERDAEQP